MDLKKLIFEEFVKNGYAKRSNNKIWDISQRKFLYMTPELAKGFLKFRKYDRYKNSVITREVALIKTQKDRLCKFVGKEEFNLIDVCCGDGSKVIELFKQVPCKKGQIKYCPINVSDYLVKLTMKNVKKANFDIINDYCSVVGDWDAKSVVKHSNNIRTKKYKKNVILLLGSVLASFDINDYLFELSNGMKMGDYLIIGNGIRLGERLVRLDSYKHKAFDDWFIHLMKEIGFRPNEVKYDARFGNSRIETFYTVNKDKKLKRDGFEMEFKRGDEILVGILYKYFAHELKKFCKMYFSEVELLKDKENEYALVICKK